MLYRFVRPMFRDGSRNAYYNRRIPADVKRLAVGLRLSLPVGEAFVSVTISPKMTALRLSLGTSDPLEVKARTARLDEHVEQVWARLRDDEPLRLTQRQAVALAGELYRSWSAGEGRERTRGVVRIPVGEIADGEPASAWEWVPDDDSMDDEPGLWTSAREHLARIAKLDAAHSANPQGRKRPLEVTFGAIIDALLSDRAILKIEPASRELLLKAFHEAMLDAAASRERNAAGDYARDPKAARFPEWEEPNAPREALAKPPAPANSRGLTFAKLLAAWWKEALAANTSRSTYESYERSFRQLKGFLGSEDVAAATTDALRKFKDTRLDEGVSLKTVKDSDFAAFRSVFGWAFDNQMLKANPTVGIKIKAPKRIRARSPGFTPGEARSLLRHALSHKRTGREGVKMAAAKRWAPWLMAYTGARVGEIAQLRKQDVQVIWNIWTLVLTPDAGETKNKAVRHVPLHPHLIEQGFLDFVEKSRNGYLFLEAKPSAGLENVGGLRQAMKNRLAEFAREAVADPNVAPSHGWRHNFATLGRELGFNKDVLNAIQGHGPADVGAEYGEVTAHAMANYIRTIPKFEA